MRYISDKTWLIAFSRFLIIDSSNESIFVSMGYSVITVKLNGWFTEPSNSWDLKLT